jgi:hypothetical protein
MPRLYTRADKDTKQNLTKGWNPRRAAGMILAARLFFSQNNQLFNEQYKARENTDFPVLSALPAPNVQSGYSASATTC